VPLRPVPSLDALAAGMAETPAASSGRSLLALIDARRGEVFAAAYDSQGLPSTTPTRIWGPLALGLPELLDRSASLEGSALAAGDWALESRDSLEAGGIEVLSDTNGVHGVSGIHLCRLALDVVPVEPQLVEPIYVRLPDAEINRRTALGGD
jgi:tRNA threonylcarbamoyladenosine biosynthesis protein TsaB